MTDTLADRLRSELMAFIDGSRQCGCSPCYGHSGRDDTLDCLQNWVDEDLPPLLADVGGDGATHRRRICRHEGAAAMTLAEHLRAILSIPSSGPKMFGGDVAQAYLDTLDKLVEARAENDRLRAALAKHHAWHLVQDRDGDAWGVDPADAYLESGLGKETIAALAPQPTGDAT